MAGFKEFVFRGNVVDLAVGVIIGGAFGKIVTAVTDDFINPILPKSTEGGDFMVGPLKVGAFLHSVIDFLILAAVVYFFIVKPYQAIMARMYPPPPPGGPPPPPPDIQLLTEIRDLLKK